jgi:hypothetical protein
MTFNPFDALGVPARPDLTDERIRTAWRQVAGTTHPDRPDGGDPARYAQASAAYAELRTPWGRTEAYADLLQTRGPATGDEDSDEDGPLPYQDIARPPGYLPLEQLPARIWHGHPLRLALRGAAAALLSLVVIALIPGRAAEPAMVTGLIIWFLFTARGDLAPPAGK